MLLMLAGLLTFGLTSCKNKKESKDIITKMPTETKQLVGAIDNAGRNDSATYCQLDGQQLPYQHHSATR